MRKKAHGMHGFPAATCLSSLRLAANLFSIEPFFGKVLFKAVSVGHQRDAFGVLVSFLFFLRMREIMADITESAEARQLLDSLKGRMLVLKEHL